MAANMSDVTDILTAFRPNRAYRRANAGARCTLCGLGIVAVDFCFVEVESTDEFGSRISTRPIHTACTALLWDEVAKLEEMADGMDEAEPGVEDASDPDLG